MYETYVTDRNNLGVKDKFRQAKNLRAYQAVVDKMLVAINKGYWQADPQVKAHLEQVNREVIAEAGVACNANSCSSAEVTALAQAQDANAMADARALPAPNLAHQSAQASQSAAGGATPSQAVAPAQARTQASQATSATPAQPSGKVDAPVEGYEVKEEKRTANALPPEATHWALAGLAILVALGFAWKARRHRS